MIREAPRWAHLEKVLTFIAKPEPAGKDFSPPVFLFLLINLYLVKK